MDRIRVPCVVPQQLVPLYRSDGSAGADLCADLSGDLCIGPGERAAVPTGLRLEIPPGFEAQIRPRSGLALASGVTVLNAPGTVDADYRGEVMVILVNLGREPFIVRPGDRIAQIIFAAAARAEFIVQPQIAGTQRGEGGFGSTGR